MVELASSASVQRLIRVRSLIFVTVVSLLAFERFPFASFDLLLGVLAGMLNMQIVMHANERLLDLRVSRSRRALENVLRLLALGLLPYLTTLWGPWWSMGITFTSFYIPYLLYAYEMQRNFRTGMM